MLNIKPMNIKDYFAPIDGSSKIANYYELKALLDAQAKASTVQIMNTPKIPKEVKSNSSQNIIKEDKPNDDLKWIAFVSLFIVSTIAYIIYQKHKDEEV